MVTEPRLPRRAVTGIVVLDKPEGMTSNRALQIARRLFRARKAGHTGSLDPLATGVLPLCFGEATKLSGRLLDSVKTYQVIGRIGERTDTGDAHGEVVERGDPGPLTAAQIESALSAFRGPIEQVPPMYSALKHEGRRLYEIARAGGSVERPPRPVTIHELDLVSWKAPDLCLRVCCSKGTYIRTLVEDIGGALGGCAHVRQLRRTRAGPFDLSQAVSLDRIEQVAAEGLDALDSLLIPADAAVGDLPSMALDATAAKRLCQGQEVPAQGAGSPGTVRLYDADGAFLGLGERDARDRVRPRRLFNRDGTTETC
ncbi:MAG: tRNA pseudouridine(55) synthase TruB [Gammaproteobacteria bacterium]